MAWQQEKQGYWLSRDLAIAEKHQVIKATLTVLRPQMDAQWIDAVTDQAGLTPNVAEALAELRERAADQGRQDLTGIPLDSEEDDQFRLLSLLTPSVMRAEGWVKLDNSEEPALDLLFRVIDAGSSAFFVLSDADHRMLCADLRRLGIDPETALMRQVVYEDSLRWFQAWAVLLVTLGLGAAGIRDVIATGVGAWDVVGGIGLLAFLSLVAYAEMSRTCHRLVLSSGMLRWQAPLGRGTIALKDLTEVRPQAMSGGRFITLRPQRPQGPVDVRRRSEFDEFVCHIRAAAPHVWVRQWRQRWWD